MDSQHRHELKTNELAEGLSHLPQLIKDNARAIIGVTLIIVALVTWPLFNSMGRQKDRAAQAKITESIQMLNGDIAKVLQSQTEDVEAQTVARDTLLKNANTLLDNAADIDNPNLAAMARIKGAQAIRTELHLQKEVDAETRDARIKKAETEYEQAFKIAVTPTVKAMAQFGLGLCSEELEQTEQAAEIYRQIVGNETYKATVFPKQAQRRLDTLADNAEVFHFAEVPVIEQPVPSPVNPVIDALPQPAPETAAEPAPAEPAAEETPEPEVE